MNKIQILLLFVISILILSCVEQQKYLQLKLKYLNDEKSIVLVYFESLPAGFGKVGNDSLMLSNNNEITNSITQTNVQVLGEPPAEAMGTLYDVNANKVQIAVNQINNDPNIAYVSDTDTENGLMLLDCTSCDSPGTNNVSVQASFNIGNIKYITPNTKVLF